MLRSKLIAAAGVAALLVAALAPASYAGHRVKPADNPHNLFPINLIGGGSVSLTDGDLQASFPSSDCVKKAALTCNDGDACQCIAATAQVYDGHSNEAVSLLLAVDTSKAFNSGTYRSCFPAGGKAMITNLPDGGELDLDTNGFACNSASFRGSYSGGYVVTGGSGPFSGAAGAGSVNLGLQFTQFDPSSGNATGGTDQMLIVGSMTVSSDPGDAH